MRPCHSGGMCTRACVTAVENTPVTRMVTVSMRSMSIPWKAFGRCCVLGCARIEASPRKSCRFTWDSLSSCITSGAAVEPCWGHSWILYCSRWHVLKTQYEPPHKLASSSKPKNFGKRRNMAISVTGFGQGRIPSPGPGPSLNLPGRGKGIGRLPRPGRWLRAERAGQEIRTA